VERTEAKWEIWYISRYRRKVGRPDIGCRISGETGCNNNNNNNIIVIIVIIIIIITKI
jgi:hypothetical protein